MALISRVWLENPPAEVRLRAGSERTHAAASAARNKGAVAPRVAEEDNSGHQMSHRPPHVVQHSSP